MSSSRLEVLADKMIRAMDAWQDAEGIFPDPQYDHFFAAADLVREALKERESESWHAVLAWLAWLDADCKTDCRQWYDMCAAMSALAEFQGFDMRAGK